jgi:hypothetical protein
MEGESYGMQNSAHVQANLRVAVIEPLVMGHIQLTLLRLYQACTKQLDLTYSQRLHHLNALSHIQLMKQLDVDRRYWLLTDAEELELRQHLREVQLTVTPAQQRQQEVCHCFFQVARRHSIVVLSQCIQSMSEL